MSFFRGFKEGYHSLGKGLSAIVNSTLLTVCYFIGIGVPSIISKVSNKSFLELNVDKNAKTYWTDLNLSKEATEKYYRQF